MEQMDQRRFQRIQFPQPVEVKTASQHFQTDCIDISLRGVLLALPAGAQWQTGQELSVRIILTAVESINMHCILMHLDNDVAGCKWESLDIDSLTSLRRLLELNLANPQAINRELADLLR